MTNRAITVTVVAIAIFTTHDVQARPRHQAPTDQASLCAAAKLEASGTYVDDALECLAKAVAKNDRDSAACLRRAARKLTDTFARHENTGACTTTGEAEVFQAFADPAIADLVSSLRGPGPSQCTKEKLLGAGEDAEDKYGCQARAVSQGAGFSIDPMCWARAEEKFAAAFHRAEKKRDCVAGTGDAQVIDGKIDALVVTTRGVIAPPASSCVPVEVTHLHGDNFHGNTRLAKIENGAVPCLHVDEGTVATCLFSVASGHVSGEWLEGPEGTFAKVGQALSLDGAPGGDYVVAARVSDAAGVSCVEPTSMDTSGWVDPGTELFSQCTVEQMGMAWNASVAESYGWNPLINYTTREVCSANNPADHPHLDNPEFVGTIIGTDGKTAYCYTGSGAALNDINGTERDGAGNYLIEGRYCHMIVSSGYEVPGAKRPATRSLPAPGSVNTSTLIVWRPVNPNVNIANDLEPNPQPETFDNKATFLAATHGESVTGELPDLGFVANGSATVGSVTFGLAPGGNTFAIGAAGTSAAPSWYPDIPGNWIALGYENLQVTFATHVHSMGFDFVEPNATMPPFGGTPVNSTYRVTLFSNATVVGTFTFNATDDVLAFVGVRSATSFNRAWIIDVTKDAAGQPSPLIGDDEYFGQFYTGRQ